MAIGVLYWAPSQGTSSTDMYDLYIANKNYSSWSLRAWVLLRELAIPYRERLVNYGGKANPGAFRGFSPTGKVPCLVDGDVTVWDSLAITEYVAERYPAVWPADAAARAFARSAAAEMHSGFFGLRNTCTMNCGIRVALHSVDDALKSDLARLETLWADGLKRFGGPFLAGPKFTAADAFYAPVAFRLQTYDPPIDDVARAYAARLRALPSMHEWYAAALADMFRSESHEAEARGVGIWRQDLRAGS